MTCNNDWDPLEEIIVGTADYATINVPNISTMKCQFPEYEESFIKEFTGFYPDQIIEEQNEDLENLSEVLKSLGVVVHRPDTSYATS